MQRKFECPLTEAPCSDPECSRTRCREREREEGAELSQKAERARREWQHAQDKQEAAVRALREFIAEKNAELETAGQPPIRMPRGQRREELVARILVSERQSGRLRRHLEAVSAERLATVNRDQRAVRVRRPRVSKLLILDEL